MKKIPNFIWVNILFLMFNMVLLFMIWHSTLTIETYQDYIMKTHTACISTNDKLDGLTQENLVAQRLIDLITNEIE